MEDLSEEELARRLAYAGLILLAFELTKSLVVNPIKLFYRDSTFGVGMSFKSYQEDVLSRDKSEFQACLLYLRDFVMAIDSDDLLAIQSLRGHRNDLAHNIPDKLPSLKIENYVPMLERATKALFKLSNHNAYIEIGHNPEFMEKGIDWETAKGHEYLLLEEVLKKVKIMGPVRM